MNTREIQRLAHNIATGFARRAAGIYDFEFGIVCGAAAYCAAFKTLTEECADTGIAPIHVARASWAAESACITLEEQRLNIA